MNFQGPKTIGSGQVNPIFSAQASKGSVQSWWIYLMMGMGFVLGWYMRRPAQKFIGDPHTDKTDVGSNIHVVPEEDVVAIMEQYAQGMLVLLCTSKERHHIFSDLAHRQSIFSMKMFHVSNTPCVCSCPNSNSWVRPY